MILRRVNNILHGGKKRKKIKANGKFRKTAKMVVNVRSRKHEQGQVSIWVNDVVWGTTCPNVFH